MNNRTESVDGAEIELNAMGRVPEAERWMKEVDGNIHIHEEHPNGGHICLLQWTPDQAKEMAKMLWEYQKVVRQKNAD
ncbi:hypothetical protein [Halococcus thailandensis]|uniref:Uncharacterized protein n=1 Tax=Halococcus thailandensis JCM 13552 TaxID=1227457 RepID=M0NID8_9EURY|nr:hypothetical protein [Halococcus thailandensis]EMA56864.1 hypothetical protein C451_00125 [Halococcus thailandensis JCM 13552]